MTIPTLAGHRTKEKLRPARLAPLDALRGLAVVGMLLVDNRGSDAMPSQFVHSPWNGLRLADLVFPLFLFAAGMSMALSRRTDRPRQVIWRTVKIAALGMAINAIRARHLYASTGVLQHVAAAYFGCWLLLRLPRRAQALVAGALLVLVWAAYAFLPAPGVVPGAYVPGHNIGDWFTSRLLHVPFSAESPHAYLPSAITTFLGVAGMRSFVRGRGAVLRLAATLGSLGGLTALWVPMNKRLWTPSYVLVTGAVAAALFLALEVVSERREKVLRPLLVLGQNAIVVFAFSELVFRGLLSSVRPHLVAAAGEAIGARASAAVYALASVVAAWALGALLDRHEVVVRI